MKVIRPTILAVGFLLLTSISFSAPRLPRGIFSLDQLEAAQAKALEEDLPLLFFHNDSKST